jgi:hypothetical protein
MAANPFGAHQAGIGIACRNMGAHIGSIRTIGRAISGFGLLAPSGGAPYLDKLDGVTHGRVPSD